jgi:hypothetical protein
MTILKLRTETKYIGRCIYCPNDATTEEHVVPIAFGGHHVLLKASCDACAHTTRDLETELCEHNFNALRFHNGYPRARGRTRKRQPDLKIIEGKTPHNAPFRKVRADQAPGTSLFPILQPPGIMMGRPRADQTPIIGIQWISTAIDGATRQQRLEASGFKGALAHAQIKPATLIRTLAKISHGYAVWNVGLDGFIPLLLPTIHGTSEDVSEFVGCNFPTGPLSPILPIPSGDRTYQIHAFEISIKNEQYLGCQIRLFTTVRPLTPVYMVIFGKRPSPT